MDVRFAVAFFCLVLASPAFADTYKCTDKEGKVSFGFAPCPTWEGESSAYGSEPPESSGIGGNESARRNRNAVENMVNQRQSQNRSNGHIGIVRDTTSGMGRDQIRKEMAAKRKAERESRAAAGLDTPSKPMNFNCYSYGSERQFTRCTGR
ncbi:DUF4124 domain-containing protein [Pseudomonas syringae]|uniref:DUF4124 domain-containing protein n=1 Tax=Pseudomonas syringae TaxID=317 RepID=UPI003D6495B2